LKRGKIGNTMGKKRRTGNKRGKRRRTGNAMGKRRRTGNTMGKRRRQTSLKDQLQQKWHSEFQNSSKTSNYRLYKDKLEFEKYSTLG
jgi:hypothetical protein